METGNRILALDVFRGFTIAGMLLVNYPGDSHVIWQQLRHAPYGGCNFADLIFPFFLFIIGVSISLSARRHLAQGQTFPSLYKKLFLRCLKLTLLAFLLHIVAIGKLEFSMGTLQRIALCSFLAFPFVFLSRVWMCVGIFGSFVIYQYLQCANAISWNERWVLGQTFVEHFDTLILGKPKANGLLSSLSATSLVLCGMCIGPFLSRIQTDVNFRMRLALLGFAISILGIVLAIPELSDSVLFSPISQRIWTPSYSLFTAGLSMLAFVFTVVCCESVQASRLVRVLVIFGQNAIAAYIFADLLNALIWSRPLSPGGATVKQWFLSSAASSFGAPLSSYLFIAVTLVMTLLFNSWLAKKEIFFKL